MSVPSRCRWRCRHSLSSAGQPGQRRGGQYVKACGWLCAPTPPRGHRRRAVTHHEEGRISCYLAPREQHAKEEKRREPHGAHTSSSVAPGSRGRGEARPASQFLCSSRFGKTPHASSQSAWGRSAWDLRYTGGGRVVPAGTHRPPCRASSSAPSAPQRSTPPLLRRHRRS